jgi:SAM-dependent methyltransferase
MDPFSPQAVRAAYDIVAADYEREFGDDLAQLPVDRWLLGLPRVQGDLCRLPLASRSLGLAIAFYSLQHLAREELVPALLELHRVLTGDGVLAVAAHLGAGNVLIDDFLGHRVPTFGGALYPLDALREAMAAAGFAVTVERQREPLPHEYESRRLYLLARPAP